MSQFTASTVTPRVSRARWSPLPGGRLELAPFLSWFVANHGRSLSPRAQRTLAELIEVLSEYLEDQGIDSIGPSTRGGTVSLSTGLHWIDVFEREEMFDAVDGERAKLRVADSAIRALSRQLASVVRC